MSLPTSSTSSASVTHAMPAPPTRRIDLLTRSFSNKIEADPTDFRARRIALRDAPSAGERAELETRRDELRRHLTPTPGREATEAIALLIGSKASFGAQPKEIVAKVGFYAQALANQPTWAIERARIRFSRPGWRCLWDGRGCPSEADVGAECRHETLPFDTELAKIEAILSARIDDTGSSETARSREVDRWWTEVRPEIQAGAVITERTEEEISTERASMARANDRFRERARIEAEAQGRGQAMWGRLPISDELARKIGLVVPVPDHHEEDVH